MDLAVVVVDEKMTVIRSCKLEQVVRCDTEECGPLCEWDEIGRSRTITAKTEAGLHSPPKTSDPFDLDNYLSLAGGSHTFQRPSYKNELESKSFTYIVLAALMREFL